MNVLAAPVGRGGDAIRFLTLVLVAAAHVVIYVVLASLRTRLSLSWLGLALAISAGVITYLLTRRRAPAIGNGAASSRASLPGFYLPFASALLVKSAADLYSGLRP